MLGTKENEERTKRRLAAKAFLTNISLSGSYKDTGWCLEYARQEREAAELAHHNLINGIKDQDGNINSEAATNLEGSALSNLPDQNGSENYNFAHHDLNVNNVPEPFSIPTTRIRSNTGSSEISCRSRTRRYISESDGYHQQRHCHFSTESGLESGLEHGIRARQISTSNISECSSPHPKELKMLNLRDNPLPTIRDERLIIMLSRRTPFLIFSALPYARNPRHTRSIERQDGSRRTRNASGTRPLSALSDPDPLELLVHNGEEEVSYGYLLQPTQKSKIEHFTSNGNQNVLPFATNRHKIGDQISHSDAFDAHAKTHPNVSRCVSYDAGVKLHGTCNLSPIPSPPDSCDNIDGEANPIPGLSNVGPTNVTSYSPHLLDDPEFRAGRHRTLLTFPSYITSVIDYCKASDLKKELNDKFKERFPSCQLTLSKLRSLKREMRRIAKTECNVDILTVAQAYVYFEKLILASFVTKYNRKLCSGACLLLSAKLNDVKGENLHSMIEKIETTFRVSRKDLLSFEFAVLVALEFSLHASTFEILPHYQRLLYEC